MQFSDGMRLKVNTLSPQGIILGWVEGNYLNLSVKETNFEDWFRTIYADQYDLQPIEVERTRAASTVRGA